MIEPQKYLFTLFPTKNIERTAEFKLGGYITIDLLHFISKNPSSFMYDCQKYLKAKGKKISYENVNERLYNLIKLGLIQKVTNLDNENKNSIEENKQGIREKPKNNTIYSITSAGIFYLFITKPRFINIKTILANKEDILFVNFLYPILNFNTLEKIKYPRTIEYITRFLGSCCEAIQSELEKLRIVDTNGGETHTLGCLRDLADSLFDHGVMYGRRIFIQGLKNSSKIKWLDIDNTKIIELEKDRLFKICDDQKNELILEIYEEKNLAVLLDHNHKIKEFNLEQEVITGDYYITCFNHTITEDYVEQRFKDRCFYFYNQIDKYQKAFCNSMLEYIDTEYPMMNKEERMIKRQDCIAIAKDKNFQKIMSNFKQDFDSRYGSFIKLSNIQ